MDYTKNLATNRKARHNYHVEKDIECGIILMGTEVKSIKAGNLNFQDSYASFENDELYLLNFHISPFKQGSYNNHEPMRKRKLLLHKRELKKVKIQAEQKGYTLIPLSVYLKGSLIKIKIGLCKGKKLYDKREDIKNRDISKSIERELKSVKNE